MAGRAEVRRERRARQLGLDQFDAKIAENKRDFDTRLAKGRVLIAEGEYAAAMDELLEIVMRDKAWGDQVPRKTVVALLELLAPPAPKPTPLRQASRLAALR